MDIASIPAAVSPAANTLGGQGWHQAADLGVALVLSAAIGLERELRQKDVREARRVRRHVRADRAAARHRLRPDQRHRGRRLRARPARHGHAPARAQGPQPGRTHRTRLRPARPPPPSRPSLLAAAPVIVDQNPVIAGVLAHNVRLSRVTGLVRLLGRITGAAASWLSSAGRRGSTGGPARPTVVFVRHGCPHSMADQDAAGGP